MLQHMHQRLHMHYCRGRAERLCRARVCARQTLYTAGRRHSPSGITRQGGTNQGARALPISPPPPPPNSSPCLGRLLLHPAAAAPAKLSRAASVRGRLEVEGEASAAEHPERQLRRAVAQRGEVLGVVVFEAHRLQRVRELAQLHVVHNRMRRRLVPPRRRQARRQVRRQRAPLAGDRRRLVALALLPQQHRQHPRVAHSQRVPLA
mmetsp:Transcript_18584/g.61258  ORF Transcript_18584/g.61258 Transcript_18584/m.61258 type:complete len:206 (+) Transcript_18584:128-745(+)